uniref:DnaJ homolog subfamily C member 8 n=1 Tax=Oncorhynchus tshawytscha TaxID=74940 RepID=A0A8C8EU92_ONCTS
MLGLDKVYKSCHTSLHSGTIKQERLRAKQASVANRHLEEKQHYGGRQNILTLAASPIYHSGRWHLPLCSDSVLTSKQQIDRLLRPGSSYFNLNPFEVLQIDPEATDEELKKRFRALSILVHPDKNQDDPDRAQLAFEAVDKAYKNLLEPEQKKRAVDVIQAGREYVEHNMKEKKKQLKKDGKPQFVEEDDPEMFRQAVYKQTMKLFAELEIKRKEREAKDMHERKRAREEEIETAEKAKREREWQKNFEETRDGRVDSWRSFQAGKGKAKKEKKPRSFLKPPKVKMEQRE